MTPVYKLSASSIKGRTYYGGMLAGNTAYAPPITVDYLVVAGGGGGGQGISGNGEGGGGGAGGLRSTVTATGGGGSRICFKFGIKHFIHSNSWCWWFCWR